MANRSSTLRSVLIVCSALCLTSFIAPAAFAGCGEICNFLECEPGEPEEGCIQRTSFCLDMLCYSTTQAACAVESAQAESRVDAALVGVDTSDTTQLVKALQTLDFPIRVVVRGEVIFQTPDFELLKKKRQAQRKAAVSEPAETTAAPRD